MDQDGTSARGESWGVMMISVAVSLLVGIVLGQRFKVLVLSPAIALTLLLTIGAGIARGDAPWAIVLTAMAMIASLQIGYLAGTGIRHFMVAPQASPRRDTGFQFPARRSAR